MDFNNQICNRPTNKFEFIDQFLIEFKKKKKFEYIIYDDLAISRTSFNKYFKSIAKNQLASRELCMRFIVRFNKYFNQDVHYIYSLFGYSAYYDWEKFALKQANEKIDYDIILYNLVKVYKKDLYKEGKNEKKG